MRSNTETVSADMHIPKYAGGIAVVAILLLVGIRVGIVKGVK